MGDDTARTLTVTLTSEGGPFRRWARIKAVAQTARQVWRLTRG